ncbi:MAG: toxin TcdB middle/N-terminal domain-containing protein, partial [Candidatus Omnitrophota bacterium]|nr:toxin TcdB middle/N-terminal domain-containing protein [Candidatus Omnitrophota bacterium]
MKRKLFRITSLVLVVTHLSLVCLRDVSFAEQGEQIPPVPQGIDFEQLGKVPDMTGHGVPAGGAAPMKLMAAGAVSSGGGASATFFQKENHTASDKFNRILESVSPDLFTGRAQMSIPIYLPGGARDIKPPISINYNSSSGNGFLGMGWSMDMGSIIRSTKKGVPKYDSNDTFAAFSEELVNIGTNEYRSKIEGGFIKYVFTGNSWEGVDKSGRKYYFGTSGNSRLNTAKGTFSWALDKICDVQGNYLSVTYYPQQGNVLYLKDISYTANDKGSLPANYRVAFSYENRNDISFSYAIGDQIKLDQRLSSIEVHFGQSRLVRRYNFLYSYSSSTGRSLLSKVVELGSDGQTASPALTFTYCSNTGGWSADQEKWHIPDGDFINSGYDKGRRVYDLNGDGMFDFVIACYDPSESDGRQYLRETHLNTADGFMSKPEWWPVPIGYFAYSVGAGVFWDDGRRLVDLTGDGIPEMLAGTLWDPATGASGRHKDAYEFKYLDRTNPGWAQAPQWNLPDGYFVYGNKLDGGKRFADLNGDGLNDLSVAMDDIRWSLRNWDHDPGSVNTYMNTGSGWRQDNRWNSPDGYFVTNSGDGGRRLTDINGDGLADWLVASDGHKATYLNTGSGWVRNDVFNIPDGDFSSGGRDQGRMLVDINGDGLSDLVIARSGYHAVYLNTGSGWRRDDSFNIPDGDFVDSDGRDQGRYLADLDGDGVVDICIAKDGYKKAYLNLAGPADLLVKAANGLGGESAIEYTPSTRYYNYYPNKTGKLPFAVQTVSKITASDGLGSSYSTSYSYSDGYFDSAEREFRGFGYVKAIDAEGNYSESYFNQDSIYKGRLSRQQQKDASGNVLSKAENTWKSAQLYPGINFPYLAQADNFIYDPSNVNNFKHTQLKYEYDGYGNPLKVFSYGDAGIGEDNKTQVTEYVYNKDIRLLSQPKYAYLLDPSGKKVSEKWFYYDGNKNVDDVPSAGKLTKEEALLRNPITGAEERISVFYEYDDYGNLISKTDPLGRKAVTVYDDSRSYPVRITNALGHSAETVYYGINESTADAIAGSGLPGQVKSAQDLNKQKSYNIYDALGRPLKGIGPLDAENAPGVAYEYDLSRCPAKITKKVKAGYGVAPEYLAAYQFSDGLGRVVEIKSPAQAGPQGQARQVISGIVKYDARGSIKEKYLPYFVNATAEFAPPDYATHHVTYTYDSLGRLVRVDNPDNSCSQVAYTLWKKTFTDAKAHSTSEYYDAYGRITKVEENNSGQIYKTLYVYDILGNLTRLTDNQNNVTDIRYDSLGRKIRMDDPDMGIWNYEYDKAGNLVKQTDAKGQVLVFDYDNINRLVKKSLRGPAGAETIALYSYDDSEKHNCIGRLSKVSDQSGFTDFFYDELGREVKSIKSVSGVGAYMVERTYDALDRLAALKYPDGEVLAYFYNPQGIEKVNGQKEYVSKIEYTATGQIALIKYGNGSETKYNYDAKTLRLSNLETQSPYGKIQDLSYQFDKAGNVSELKDYINTATQSFQYDDLNRLTRAQGAYGDFKYIYDSIGNMTQKEGMSLSYGQNGKLPHAVTSLRGAAGAEAISISYDDNGNMAKKGDLNLFYDPENRLVKTEDKSSAPVAQTITVDLVLNPGWNFISLPILPPDLKISSVLSGISGKYDQVSRYNPAAKKFEHYAGIAKYDQFDTFEYGRGYQIYINSAMPVVLSVTGILPLSKAVSLAAGTDLIFSPKSMDTAVETALAPLKLGVNYSKVLFYNASSGSFQECSAAKKEFTVLKPGVAYYLYCPKAVSWAISNPPASASAAFTYDGDGGRVKRTTNDGRRTTVYIGSLFEIGPSGSTSKHIFSGANRVCDIRTTNDGIRTTNYYHSD